MKCSSASNHVEIVKAEVFTMSIMFVLRWPQSSRCSKYTIIFERRRFAEKASMMYIEPNEVSKNGKQILGRRKPYLPTVLHFQQIFFKMLQIEFSYRFNPAFLPKQWELSKGGIFWILTSRPPCIFSKLYFLKWFRLSYQILALQFQLLKTSPNEQENQENSSFLVSAAKIQQELF